MMPFPEGFLWGAATAAYQIEGSPLADGAGSNIWHRFSHTPGRVANGDTGDVACDHYRRWAEDIEWVTRLGLRSYRLSMAWARVLPDGRGRVNPAGIDFYSRLVDALLASGIQPLITLYHWDLPSAVDDRGGWLNPDVAHWFADYADVAFRALGDRVPMWATLNEPWVVVDGGYLYGVHAPGHRNLYEAPIAAHNLMRAHGAAVQRYRAGGWQHRIGYVVNLEPKDPASESVEDVAACARSDAYMNRQYLDPVFLGRPTENLREIFGDAWVEFPAADYELIRQPIDFLGVNYYTRGVMQHDATMWPMHASKAPQPGLHTETNWEVYPEGLTRALCFVKERYGDIPLYVTENGAAFPDPPTVAGELLEDPLRVAYYRDHLNAALEAIRRGVNLRGYYAWSLLDNFEWASGFSKRFGLLHVDYATQKRMLKASGEFYARVVRSNGAELATLGLS